jgi:hypothetical protein
MFGIFNTKKDKEAESKELSNLYLDELTCDVHMLNYQKCLKSWKTFNKKKCDTNINEYQYCMVSLNTDTEEYKQKQQQKLKEKHLSEKIEPSLKL